MESITQKEAVRFVGFKEHEMDKGRVFLVRSGRRVKFGFPEAAQVPLGEAGGFIARIKPSNLR